MPETASPGFRVEQDRERRLARLVLAAPPLNVLTTALATALAAEVRRLSERPEHRVLVVAAEGKAFSAGASIEEHVEPADALAMLAAMEALVLAVDEHPRPVVALVRGVCLGGGLELALACDLVWASKRAAFGCPEIKLGVLAPFASALLPRRIGLGGALDLLLTGEAIPAKAARKMGLIDRYYDDEEFDAASAADLQKLTLRSGAALGIARRAVREAVAAPTLAGAIGAARERYRLDVLPLADAREGLNAFLEKRPALWQDR